jgi:type IV secretory pathway VirJ component
VLPGSALAVIASLALVLAPPLAQAAAPADAPAADETLEFGPFGTVTLYRATPHPNRVVLFVSGDGGWNLGVVDMARSLATLDALVVGIDINHYLEAAAAAPGDCTYGAADFEQLGQFVQKKLEFPRYQPPVLVGYSSGATLVYALLVEAPGGTFRGALSMGFCPDLPLAKPLCKGSGLEWDPGPHGKGVSFRPAARLAAPWVVLQGVIDQVCDAAETGRYVRQVGGGTVVMLSRVGHGYSVPANWLPQFEKAFAGIVAAAPEEAAAPPAAVAAAGNGTEEGRPPAPATASVADLPLVELPATDPPGAGGDPGDALAVILSGDGGWTSLDKQVGQALAADGIPVAGWNSLQYYWTARTPESAAADLARILRHYLTVWHKEKAYLIGYSLGADVLPFLFNRLPEDVAARVPLVVLIGASHTATFEFHVSEWLGGGGKDLPKTLPEAGKIRAPRLLCFYGDTEKDTICPELKAPNARAVRLSGGHHFGGDYEGIARRILVEVSQPPVGGEG